MATRSRRGGEEDGFGVAATVTSGVVAALLLVPVAYLVAQAASVGVGASVAILTRPDTVQVLVNSVALVTVVTAASVAVGVPLAYLTVRTDLPYRRATTILVSLPLVVPSYIGAFAFVAAFGPRGALLRLLAPLGVERLPEIYGFGGAALVLALYTYPYVYITTRAALRALDARLVDAARTLGEGPVSAFRRVTWPRVRPAVAAGSLLVALYALADFGTPAIMQFDAFTRVIYVDFTAFRQNRAALLSLQLLAATLLILGLESMVRNDDPVYAGAGSRSGDRVRLGPWRWPAFVGALAVPVLALGVPLGVLLTWFVRGSATAGGTLATGPGVVLNSVSVAAAAALVAVLVGVPVAYASATRDSRLAGLFERVSYLGYAVPGVVLGLALVYLGVNALGPVYPTIALLVVAYVVRFLPQAVGSVRAAVLQVDPALPEAARTLGRSSVGAFRSVTLPLVAPGVAGGAALVFLTTMKELPATLLLRPAGFSTLVTRVWTAHSDGYFGAAVVPALVLLVVSGLSMLVIISREGYDVR
jgi:iron(III) transport system permease protein